jgi:hypothetical protein
MVAFTGVCRVHLAEIMQVRGAWQDAIEEAQRARERFQGIDQQAAAVAFYQQAEVHRLSGEFAAAEDAYRSASQGGLEPHRASRSCGWRKDVSTLRPQQSAARWVQPLIAWRARSSAGARRDHVGGWRKPGRARGVSRARKDRTGF